MAYFGQPKTPKSEEEYKTPYTTVWIHSITRVEADINCIKRNYVKIVSIDPGSKNFAIRIERRYITGIMQPDYYSVWDVRTSDKCKTDPNEPVLCYRNLAAELDKVKPYFLDTNVIIIERQLPINYKTALIMQSAIMYFTIILKDVSYYPVIYVVDPKLKGRMLGAPPRLTKPELKQWAVGKAKELFTLRQDTWSLEIINNNKKADDLGDTAVQLEALLMYWNHPLATFKH